MKKQAKKIMVLSMASLLVMSNAVPVFASATASGSGQISSNISSTEQAVLSSVFRSAGMELNLTGNAPSRLQYAGAMKDEKSSAFATMFMSSKSDTDKLAEDAVWIFARYTDPTLAGAEATDEILNVLNQSIQESIKTGLVGTNGVTLNSNRSVVFAGVDGQRWAYNEINLNIKDTTTQAVVPESADVKIGLALTFKNSDLYMLMYVGNATTSEYAKTFNETMLASLKLTGSQEISGGTTGYISATEAGAPSLSTSGVDVGSMMNNGLNNTTNNTPNVSGSTNVAGTVEFAIPGGLNLDSSRTTSTWVYLPEAQNKVFRGTLANGISAEVGIVVADQKALDAKSYDNFTVASDFYTNAEKLLNGTLGDRINTIENYTDANGKNWKLYISKSNDTYNYVQAVNDNIKGNAVVIECTTYLRGSGDSCLETIKSIINSTK